MCFLVKKINYFYIFKYFCLFFIKKNQLRGYVMKNLLAPLLSFVVFCSTTGQNYNLGFEDWNTNITFHPQALSIISPSCYPYLIGNCEFTDPAGTSLANNSILPYWSAIPYGLMRTTDSYAGTYAAIVHMWYNGAKGVLAFGSKADVIQNVPKVHLPSKLFGVSGYYKYKRDVLVSTDSINKGTYLNIVTYKKDNSGNLLELTRDMHAFSLTDVYKPFALSISYPNNNTVPDSLSIWFDSRTNNSGTTACELAHFLYLDDLKFHFDALSTNNEVLQPKITIFPNPSREIINIVHDTDADIVNIQLLDIKGRKIKNFHKNKQLNINDLPTGIYLLNIETKQGIYTEKVVIE